MRKVLPVVGGVTGAVIGFLAVVLVLGAVGFGNPADPIMSGLLVLVVFAPAGAVAGLLAGTSLAMRICGSTGGLAIDSLKAFAVVVVLVGAGGGVSYWYFLATATPWLNPNAPTPLLQFEVRLSAGAELPASARDIGVELQTDLNTMPGELVPAQFRRDGNRAVIVGSVNLAFRTPNRQLAVTIKGQPARVYRIGLTDKAPHARELGPWQQHADGSEIRYRAQWPGRD